MDVDVAKFFNATIVRSNKFSLYIPNKTRDGRKIKNQQKWINKAPTIMSKYNGGATAMPPIRGAWLEKGKDIDKLVAEEPVIVYSYIDPDTYKSFFFDMKNFADELANDTNQGQIAIEFNSELLLIDY